MVLCTNIGLYKHFVVISFFFGDSYRDSDCMLLVEVMTMLTNYDVDQLCLFDDEMFREWPRGLD